MLDPSITLYVAAAIGALAGVVGGVGGRAFFTRARFAEVWNAINSLDHRLSKREGAAGNQRAKANDLESRELLSALLKGKAPAAAPPGMPTDPQEYVELMNQRATEHFNRRDTKKKTEPTE